MGEEAHVTTAHRAIVRLQRLLGVGLRSQEDALDNLLEISGTDRKALAAAIEEAGNEKPDVPEYERCGWCETANRRKARDCSIWIERVPKDNADFLPEHALARFLLSDRYYCLCGIWNTFGSAIPFWEKDEFYGLLLVVHSTNGDEKAVEKDWTTHRISKSTSGGNCLPIDTKPPPEQDPRDEKNGLLVVSSASGFKSILLGAGRIRTCSRKDLDEGRDADSVVLADFPLGERQKYDIALNKLHDEFRSVVLSTVWLQCGLASTTGQYEIWGGDTSLGEGLLKSLVKMEADTSGRAFSSARRLLVLAKDSSSRALEPFLPKLESDEAEDTSRAGEKLDMVDGMGVNAWQAQVPTLLGWEETPGVGVRQSRSVLSWIAPRLPRPLYTWIEDALASELADRNLEAVDSVVRAAEVAIVIALGMQRQRDIEEARSLSDESENAVPEKQTLGNLLDLLSTCLRCTDASSEWFEPQEVSLLESIVSSGQKINEKRGILFYEPGIARRESCKHAEEALELLTTVVMSMYRLHYLPAVVECDHLVPDSPPALRVRILDGAGSAWRVVRDNALARDMEEGARCLAFVRWPVPPGEEIRFLHNWLQPQDEKDWLGVTDDGRLVLHRPRIDGEPGTVEREPRRARPIGRVGTPSRIDILLPFEEHPVQVRPGGGYEAMLGLVWLTDWVWSLLTAAIGAEQGTRREEMSVDGPGSRGLHALLEEEGAGTIASHLKRTAEHALARIREERNTFHHELATVESGPERVARLCELMNQAAEKARWASWRFDGDADSSAVSMGEGEPVELRSPWILRSHSGRPIYCRGGICEGWRDREIGVLDEEAVREHLFEKDIVRMGEQRRAEERAAEKSRIAFSKPIDVDRSARKRPQRTRGTGVHSQ